MACTCSVSPVIRTGALAPSQLDLRLNAAALQCSSLTPRSEKALSDISREFDNIFSQFSASESPTPAHTQVLQLSQATWAGWPPLHKAPAMSRLQARKNRSHSVLLSVSCQLGSS